jgi:hypothetical protein
MATAANRFMARPSLRRLGQWAQRYPPPRHAVKGRAAEDRGAASDSVQNVATVAPPGARSSLEQWLVGEDPPAGHVISEDQTIALELSQRPEHPGRLRSEELGQPLSRERELGPGLRLTSPHLRQDPLGQTVGPVGLLVFMPGVAVSRNGRG